MMRKELLRQWIARNNLTLRQVANSLGVTPRTLYNRMRRGDFRANEMACLIRLLRITNPSEVFFDFREP